MGEDQPGNTLSWWSLELVEPLPNIFQEIKVAYQEDRVTKALLQEVLNKPTSLPEYCVYDGLLLCKERIVIPNNQELRLKLMKYLHDYQISGHGLTKTLHKAYKEVMWPGLKRDIRNYVQSCRVCQTCKFDQQKPVGLLQPLPLPNETWTNISMETGV